MTCRAEAAASLRAKGLRVTNARLAVMAALRHAGEHMTPPQVLQAARSGVPHVDPSTVYRTLTELRDARLVTETPLGRGDSFYEWNGAAPHHHLRCSICGDLAGLDSDLVASLATRLKARHGFALGDDHLVLTGTCAACEAKSG